MKFKDVILKKLYLILITSYLWDSAGIGMVIGRYKISFCDWSKIRNEKRKRKY